MSSNALIPVRYDLSSINRKEVLTGCFVFMAVVAVCDFLLPSLSLGVLYVIPLMISAVFLERWKIFGLAILLSILREMFGPTPWQGDVIARFPLTVIAFGGASLFVSELAKRRRAEALSMRRITEAEQEARVLVESSPAAIITVNPDGSIELVNDTARRMLASTSESLAGQDVRQYLPMLGDFLKSKKAGSLVRAMVEGSGRRKNGEMFFAQMWVSSYETTIGTKLAIVFADASEQLRDREELGLRQLLTNSRIIVGAVSHELRNLAAAASYLHENIAKAGLEGEDFSALGRLIEAMRKLAAADIPSNAEDVLMGVDVGSLFQELHIILSSWFADAAAELRWEVVDDLPRVRADHSGLLQVLLNLAQNSRSALNGRPNGVITVAAYQLGASVVMHFSDNGPGIPSTAGLFQPFQPGATSTGLGLYVSRAIIRTYGGELQYIRKSGEGRFVIELPAMIPQAAGANE